MISQQREVTHNKEFFFTLGYVWAYVAYRVGLQRWLYVIRPKSKWRKRAYRLGSKEGWQVAKQYGHKVKEEAKKVVLPKEAKDDLDCLGKRGLVELIAIQNKFPTDFVPFRDN